MAETTRKFAVFNPHNKPVDELPVIWGFCNGGQPRLWSGELLSDDGEFLGDHICSSEGYMLGDLGILEGFRPDRHETFQKHYPDGYRMDFVSNDDVPTHAGIKAAYERHVAKYPPEPVEQQSA